MCKNAASDTANVSPAAYRLLNIRDAVSAIMFRTPAMDQVWRGDAWFVCSLIASARTSLAATIDLDELSLLAQLTVGVLSHQAAACANCIGAMCSRTKNWPSSPAISRLEFVMLPCGFKNVTTRACISGGNSSRQTVSGRDLFPDIHTPPAPSFDASQ